MTIKTWLATLPVAIAVLWPIAGAAQAPKANGETLKIQNYAGTTGNLARAQIQLYKALGGGWSPDRDPEPARSTS